jgi:hypothetical protein
MGERPGHNNEEQQEEEKEKGLEGLKDLLHRILEELTTENPKSRPRRSRSLDSLKQGMPIKN